VNEDALKLTSYFGERQRTADNGFAADALLDLYGRHAIATSILLRGVEGFGIRQHLRTDRSLTMSDDLPLIAVAVDTRPRIEGLLESTSGLLRSGLVTLERARLLTGDIESPRPGEGPDDETKLTTCCTGGASPARPRCWAWTGPPTGDASGPPSSAATRALR
jgi:PII-like signaling protein